MFNSGLMATYFSLLPDKSLAPSKNFRLQWHVASVEFAKGIENQVEVISRSFLAVCEIVTKTFRDCVMGTGCLYSGVFGPGVLEVWECTESYCHEGF